MALPADAGRQPASTNTELAFRAADGQRIEIQAAPRRLLRGGSAVPLGGRAFDLLVALASRPGRVVSRSELLDLVWPDQMVEENNLAVQVNALRKALGGDTVATVPGRGYCFAAPLLTQGPDAQAAPGTADGAAMPALRTNLPAVLPPLTGRADDLAALAALADAHRLVTVLGPAGIGKTCIARALLDARRTQHAHGVCFIELAALSDGAALPGAVAAALGLPQPGGAQPVAALVRSLVSLQLVIALDNAEHLVAAVADLAVAIWQHAPGVRLIVASQVRLDIGGEQLYRLGALALPDERADLATASACGAVALFTLRARAQDARFVLDEASLPQVVALCRRLEGSPLAIELAAARIRGLGLPGLLQGMQQRLQLLTGGRRDVPHRHRTLRAALDWSHGLLSADERLVFRRLVVFVGSFSLAAALAVLTDPAPDALDEWTALDALCTLVERSLVELLPDPADPAAPARYRYLDTPLAYAREQLAGAGEMPRLHAQHARAMRALFEAARGALHRGDRRYDAWQAQYEADADNGLAAVSWAVAHDPACALALAPVLSRLIFGRRHADAKAMWLAVEPLLDAALAADAAQAAPSGDAVPVQALARAAWECGKFWGNTRSAHSTLRCRQAVTLALRCGDRQTAYMALGQLAWGCGSEGDLQGLKALMSQRQALHDPGWPPFFEAASFEHESWLYSLENDPDGEIRCLARLAERSRAAGLGDAVYLANMTAALLEAGRFGEALTHARERVALAAGQRHVPALRHDMNNLVRACVAQGLAGAARAALRDFWPLALRHDMQTRWADGAAALALLERRPLVAMALLGHADALFAGAGTLRQPGEDGMVERVRQAAASALGDAAAEHARQRGRTAGWTDQVLHDLAMGQGPGLPPQQAA